MSWTRIRITLKAGSISATAMQASSVTYTFTQQFQVPAQDAFKWATDYQPNDLALMGEKGKRRIRRLTEDAIILEEGVRVGAKTIWKVKLVRVNPRTLSWHNIQLQGPNKYSEFIYEVTSRGSRKSKLTYTGLLVVYSKNRLSRQRLRQVANREKRYDSKAWKLLANAMVKDYQRNKHS